MTRFKSLDKFTISSKPAFVTYIHGGVFVPVMNPSSGPSYYTFSSSNNPSLQLMYWDSGAYVTELKLSTAEDDAAANKTISNRGDAQSKGTKDSDKGKKRKADATSGAHARKLAMPTQLKFWSNRHAELHGTNRDGAGNPAEGSSSATPAINPATEADIEMADRPAPSFADYKRLACLLCARESFASAEQLDQHERESKLHKEKLKDVKARQWGVCLLMMFGVIPMHTPNYEGSKDEYRDKIEWEYSIPPSARSFADLKRIGCVLCLAQLDTPAKLLAHDRMSEHHREQLTKQEAVKFGENQLRLAGIAQARPEYRDRAKERRKAFGDDSNARRRPSVAEEEETPAQTTSIGATLLTKMGWSEGSGLGAQGTGVTQPIPTEIYAQGVGLGAQGGRLGDAVEEAGRNTRNRYDEFLEKTKSVARQRYEDLDRS
jgi:RNA-binding protein 5/10